MNTAAPSPDVAQRLPATRYSLPATPAPAAPALPPITRVLAGALVLQRTFLEVRQTATLLVQWLREHLTWQTRMSHQAREVDDPLEAALARIETALPRFKASFANDRARLRHQNMLDLRCIIEAARETHRRTETLSRALTPTIPPTLQAE